MSDLMLHGVLNMPLPNNPKDLGQIEWMQFRDRARQASNHIRALEAQLAQRHAALKAADDLALALEDCQGNGGIPINILGYSPAQKLDAAQSAYRKARGQDAG